MVILPNVINRFNVISVEIPTVFFTELGKNPKIYMEPEKAQNIPSNPEQEHTEEASQYQTSNYITKLIRRYKQHDAQKQMWGCPSSPRHLQPSELWQTYSENIQWKKIISLNKCCWESWLSTYKRMNIDPCLSLCTEVRSKWTKD